MTGLIIGICAASVFCALLTALSPEGGMGRFVSLVCSLFMIILVIGSFIGLADIREGIVPFVSYGAETEEYSSADWLVEASAKEIGRSVWEYVGEKYGYYGVVSVTVDTSDMGAVTLKKVTVDLTGVSVTGGAYEIEAELSKALCCPVEVKVK